MEEGDDDGVGLIGVSCYYIRRLNPLPSFFFLSPQRTVVWNKLPASDRSVGFLLLLLLLVWLTLCFPSSCDCDDGILVSLEGLSKTRY